MFVKPSLSNGIFHAPFGEFFGEAFRRRSFRDITTEQITINPSRALTGLAPISTGNSEPSFRRPVN
jgi:hypothetical protein